MRMKKNTSEFSVILGNNTESVMAACKCSARRKPHFGQLAILVSLSLIPYQLSHADEIQLESIDVEAAWSGQYGIPLDISSSTGSRIGLTLHETPASLEVITREMMRARGYTTTEQAVGSATGVLAGQCFGITCYSMRGFSGMTSLPFLYNGLRYPGLAISPRGTFNYDRIEVIKGPASVLHGLGSVTGAVNYVAKAADGKEEKEVFLAYGRGNKKTAGLGVGGQVQDMLAYRADVSYVDANKGSYGYVDRSSFEYLHFTGEVALQLTDHFKAVLSQEWFQDNGEGYFGSPHVDGKLVRKTRYNNYNVDDDAMDKEQAWTRLNLEWALNDGFRLRNETYYNNENRLWRNAEYYAYNPGTRLVNRGDFLHIKHDQELLGNRAEAAFDHQIGSMRNRLVAGFDISRNKHQRNNNSPYISPANAVDFIDPVPGVFVTNSAFSPQRRTELLQRAWFVENYLNLTDKLKLSISGRHDDLDLDSLDLRNPDNDFHKHYSGNSWRLGAVYDLFADLSVYAQWSHAFEPPSQIVTLTPANKDFELTKARQKEIGLKSGLPNQLGEVTLSLFDIVRSNVLTRDPNNPGQVIQIGEQSSYGIEVASVLRPSAKWTIEANASVLNAEFEKFYERVAGVAVSRAGNTPTDAPERIANLWLTYRPNVDWRLGAGAHLVGKRYADNANETSMSGYTTYDAHVARKLYGGELMFSVRNLTDKFYANRSYGSTQFMLGEPRFAEISWHATF